MEFQKRVVCELCGRKIEDEEKRDMMYVGVVTGYAPKDKPENVSPIVRLVQDPICCCGIGYTETGIRYMTMLNVCDDCQLRVS